MYSISPIIFQKKNLFWKNIENYLQTLNPHFKVDLKKINIYITGKYYWLFTRYRAHLDFLEIFLFAFLCALDLTTELISFCEN